MSIVAAIKKIFKDKHDDEVELLADKGRQLDERIEELERLATINGEEGWFLEYVKRDPSCALKVLRECDKNGTIP